VLGGLRLGHPPNLSTHASTLQAIYVLSWLCVPNRATTG
jgi:hypothetical protein